MWGFPDPTLHTYIYIYTYTIQYIMDTSLQIIYILYLSPKPPQQKAILKSHQRRRFRPRTHQRAEVRGQVVSLTRAVCSWTHGPQKNAGTESYHNNNSTRALILYEKTFFLTLQHPFKSHQNPVRTFKNPEEIRAVLTWPNFIICMRVKSP